MRLFTDLNMRWDIVHASQFELVSHALNPSAAWLPHKRRSCERRRLGDQSRLRPRRLPNTWFVTHRQNGGCGGCAALAHPTSQNSKAWWAHKDSNLGPA